MVEAKAGSNGVACVVTGDHGVALAGRMGDGDAAVGSTDGHHTTSDQRVQNLIRPVDFREDGGDGGQSFGPVEIEAGVTQFPQQHVGAQPGSFALDAGHRHRAAC